MHINQTSPPEPPRFQKPSTKYDRISIWLASGLGSGYAPVSPGTSGSAAAFFLWFLVPTMSFMTGALLSLLLLVGGTYVIHRALRFDEREDPQWIVIDEWCGLSFTLLAYAPHDPTWVPYAAFLAFRLFDITKIPPVSHAERLPGAFGIMLDDVVAGVLGYGLVILLKCLV